MLRLTWACRCLGKNTINANLRTLAFFGPNYMCQGMLGASYHIMRRAVSRQAPKAGVLLLRHTSRL